MTTTKEQLKYLYKYCPINLFTIKMILSSEAYFSHPIDFNDPFDCNIIPDVNYDNEELEKYILNIKEREKPKIIEKEIQGFFDNPTVVLYSNIRESIKLVRNNLRLFCLSETDNNVMMFSHYGDKHKGICLEFTVNNDPFFNYLDYVRYSKAIPVFNPFKDNLIVSQQELVEFEILTKSISWFYEKEWRIIKQGPEPAFYKYPPYLLSSIIFGYQTSSEDKLMIKRVVENRESKIQLKEAIKKEKSFDLEIKPYKS